ncbi:MAG: aconitate hydratase, partial [Enterorhabdus sp.]|nr:aconitate hydratase [Enterorhabdus sp.]
MGFASTLKVGDAAYTYYPVSTIEGADRLPFSLTVLLENVLRCGRTPDEAAAMAARVTEAGLAGHTGEEVEFSPARVLFQDFTGVPVFVDFAVMREACAELGGDPKKINPQVPCDLVIDHSVIADEAGCAGCMDENMKLEFARNSERYDFLKWAQESFENVRIVPPGQGICHQLNIEKFASVVMESPSGLTGADGTP